MLFKLGTGCKDTLVICNSIFFIFLNQIKAQRDQKIIVWVEYFPYKYSFKVFQMTNAIKALLQMASVSLQPGGALFEVIRKVACAQISNMRMVLRISLSDRSQYHSHVADLRTRNFANNFK
jgi:hypothetical protein